MLKVSDFSSPGSWARELKTDLRTNARQIAATFLSTLKARGLGGLPMALKLLSLVISSILLGLTASAQFGPARETPLSADEIYADRAMQDAAALSSGRPGDVISADDGIDLAQAEIWFQRAKDRYAGLCDDRSQPRDVWARNCYKLANMYRRGQGTVQNYATAKTLFEASCLGGQHTPSCLQQAYIDHTGASGERDWPSARRLYTLACDRGDMSGCAGLGNMLYRGQGGSEDRSRGARLLQQACAAQFTWACDRLQGFGLPRRALQ
jgi:TPR repeat protein